jgi:hypothetical protein
MLKKLCTKGWMIPSVRGNSKRIVRYELARDCWITLNKLAGKHPVNITINRYRRITNGKPPVILMEFDHLTLIPPI